MTTKETSPDEIDVSVLLLKLAHFFSSLNKKFFSILNTFKKRWLLITICLLLGAGTGFLFFITIKPTYSTNMIVVSAGLSNQYCNDLIQDLRITQQQDSILFSHKLNIPVAIARKVVDIEFSMYDKKMKLREDSLTVGFPFRINLTVYDPAIISTMQTAIVNYLENNEYALKRKYLQKQKIDLLTKKLNHEISQLDSLKGIVAQSLIPKTTQAGIVMGERLDPVKVYQEAINLYREELNLNMQMALIDNIEVINGFIQKQKPDRPLTKTIFYGGAIGLLLGCYIALRKEKKTTIQ